MPGADEQLIERRRRKDAASNKYAKAHIERIETTYKEKIEPNLTRVLTGECTGIDLQRKTITVRFDPLPDDLNIEIEEVIWDRPKLTAASVRNKRVKVFVSKSGDQVGATLAAITSA